MSSADSFRPVELQRELLCRCGVDLVTRDELVRKLERSRRFYEEVLGFTTAFARGDTVWLEAGGDLLGLSQGEPAECGANHFGFRVEDPERVDEWVALLEKHAVPLEKGPYDRSDGRSVYFRDPDGYLLEIFWIDPALLDGPT